MDKLFFIITTNKYPEGDAGAIREHSFCCILRKLGYRPIVVGLGPTTEFSSREYDNVTYYSLRYPRNDKISKASSYLLFGLNLKRVFQKYKKQNISGIIFVTGSERTLNLLKNFCAKRNVQLYHDSVEWYSPSEFVKGEKAKGYIKNNKLNTELIDEKIKVFAISSFLENHFKSRNIKAIRVPVIMDVNNIKAKKCVNPEYIKVVYAGQMGKKDKIVNFIKALPLLSQEELKKIKVCIIGLTKEAYENVHGKIPDEVSTCVTFTGRVPRSEVLKHLETADFTMLLRPEDERYAMAGFPTKVVESLSSSTPVISNLTSDLGMYLQDGCNSIVVNGTTVEDCAKALKKAVSVSYEQRLEMQKKSRETAEKEFDYEVYISEFEEFISL